jgi:hypothetical protein
MKKAVIISVLILLPLIAFGRQIQLYQKNLFSSANLKHYYRMEGNSNDSKASDNGTDTSVSYSTANGILGQGANFNGTASKIALATLPLSGLLSTFSVVAWINTSASGARRGITAFGNSGVTNQGESFYMGTDNKLHSDLSNVAGPVSSSTINDGKWHCVAITDSAGIFQLYSDGTATGTPVSMSSPNITAGAQNIGEDFATFWSGNIDDIDYWLIALTASNISNICTSRSLEGNGISR